MSSLVVRGGIKTSDGGQDEDEKIFGPMGREEKYFLEKRKFGERGLVGAKVRG
jgi:hypothetical protein